MDDTGINRYSSSIRTINFSNPADNRIITLAKKIPAITIRVENPVHWLMEVSADENNQ
jgi:hypothetical protein